MRRNLVTGLLCALLACVFAACEEDEKSWEALPTVKTGDVVSVASNTATVEGSVTDAADQRVNGYGIVYSEDYNFDPESGYDLDRKVPSESGSSEDFSVTLTGLTAMVTYYYCAYVETDNGTFFGRVKNFITVPAVLKAPTMPVVTSKEGTVIYVSTKLDFTGSNEGFELGFCWKAVRSDYTEPTLGNCDDSNNISNVNEYTMGFQAETDAIYAVRAYAHSYQTGEIVYSETMYVTLQETPLVSPVQPQATATQEGVGFWAMALNFTNMNITEQGFCYSETTSSPTVDDAAHKVVDTATEDLTRIEAVIPGISADDFYYVRAYCVADGVTYYGPTYIYGTREAGIYTLEDLIAFRNARNNDEWDMSMWKNDAGEINLYSDIDMSSVENWIPIETLYTDEVFKGNGHTLSNFTITTYMTSEYDYPELYGLFSRNDGAIQNLHVTGSIQLEVPNEYYGAYVGAICGTNQTSITGCSSAVNIKVTSASNSADLYVGGIVGQSGNTLKNCSNTGSVEGVSTQAYVGGIVGKTEYESTISGCVNEGVIGQGLQCYAIGGIVAHASFTDILSCTNSGDVKGYQGATYVGGISGYCNGSSSDSYSLIDQCTNNGAVSGGGASGNDSYVGGIVGSMMGGITSCSNTGTVTSGNDNQYVGTICGLLRNEQNLYTGNSSTIEGAQIGEDRRPPIVGNVTVTSCTSTTAVLTAEVQDLGGSTSIREAGVRYGVSADYSQYSESGTLEGNVITVTLTDLIPGTRYYVWAYARNEYGTTQSSSSVSFTTPVADDDPAEEQPSEDEQPQ